VASSARLFGEIAAADRPAGLRRLMGRAVVLGGSVAGLMAARVLSDHAEEVLIVERDDVAGAAGVRPGAPQGSQVHALLPAGQVQLERWFPGFTDEALALGAPPSEGRHARMYLNGVRRTAPFPPSRRPSLITTRPFLEALLRRRTEALPNVSTVQGRVDGLEFDGRRVTAVRYRPAGDADPVVLTADFVVDATGRGSKLNDWLGENGWDRAPMTRMPIRLNYATAMFTADPAVSDTWVVVSHTTPGPGRVARIGGINTVEGGRWIMLVAGYDEDRPTRDPADFTARCRRDFPAAFGDIAERGERLGDVITYHQADSRRRDFHRARNLPAGLVAVGDAVASFNPVYGQGMTSATLHASALSAYLRGGPALRDVPAHDFFARAKVVVDAAWQVSTFADLELPHVDTARPRGYRVVKWCSERVSRAALSDPVVSARMDRVTTMMAHPSTLASPGLLLRAVRHRPEDRAGG
jgi:2-polyprenyl-6-methoxyphenol hydroxylase-like FAD-dependent oxidoreductase